MGSSGLTGRPTDVPLCNLFLCDQLASLSFRNLRKNTVNSFIGLHGFCFLGLNLLEKRLVGLESLRKCSLTQDLTILSEGNDEVGNRSCQGYVVGLRLCQPKTLRAGYNNVPPKGQSAHELGRPPSISQRSTSPCAHPKQPRCRPRSKPGLANKQL